MAKKLFLLLILIFLSAAIFLFSNSYTGLVIGPGEKAFVERIVDGDTLIITGGQSVRLLGINAPERGQKCWNESRDYLQAAVLDRTVTLEKDVTDKDKYGRLLRHIYLDSRHVNLELVENGLASVYTVEPDEKFQDSFAQAEARAKENGLCMWGKSGLVDSAGASCIGIFQMHSNAKGDDRENLNDEYVVFRNSCNYPVDMAGYSVADSGRSRYAFPDYSFGPKAKLALHTGSGANNETDLFWGAGFPVWNNDGDRVMMFDSNATLVLDYSYKY